MDDEAKLTPMDPPGRLAAPSAEDIGASITPRISSIVDVVLKVSLPDDSWALHILVPASPTQHRSLSSLRRYYENIMVVHDPIECTDWVKYGALELWRCSVIPFFRR